MAHRFIPRRGSRVSRLFVSWVIVASVILLLGALTIGCGDGSSDPGTTATTAATGTTTVSTPSAAIGATEPASIASATGTDWQELADAVFAIWSESLQQLNVLLDDLPEPTTVEAEVRSLKEESIRELVALGRIRETLTTSDRESIDSRLWSNLYATEDEGWYQLYADIHKAYIYANADVDFCNLVQSFNILTQYADFALLKEQEPEEAARLGID